MCSSFSSNLDIFNFNTIFELYQCLLDLKKHSQTTKERKRKQFLKYFSRKPKKKKKRNPNNCFQKLDGRRKQGEGLGLRTRGITYHFTCRN